MTSVDTARDVAVLWTLDFDAELPCESQLHELEGILCSGKATYFVTTAYGRAHTACKNAGAEIKSAIESCECVCLCDAPYHECVSIRPI
jgi:hypothetical protein